MHILLLKFSNCVPGKISPLRTFTDIRTITIIRGGISDIMGLLMIISSGIGMVVSFGTEVFIIADSAWTNGLKEGESAVKSREVEVKERVEEDSFSFMEDRSAPPQVNRGINFDNYHSGGKLLPS